MNFKKKKVEGLWRYDIPDSICRKMLKSASDARKNTYPKPNKYACALLTKKGNIYQGASYDSDTYTLTMHGEMTALAHAAIHGEKEIIAITGPNCHICKQILWESCINSGIDIIIVLKEGRKIKKIPLSTMMSYPWPAKDGTK